MALKLLLLVQLVTSQKTALEQSVQLFDRGGADRELRRWTDDIISSPLFNAAVTNGGAEHKT